MRARQATQPWYDINSAVSPQFYVAPEYGSNCSGGGCHWVGGVTAEGHMYDNNVLAYSGDGSAVVDHYRLRIEPALVDSVYHLTLTETVADASAIDSVGLVLVDHDPEAKVAVSHDGTIYCFADTRPVVDAVDRNCNPVTGLLSAIDDTLNVHGFSGDHVTANLGVADSTSALYVVSDIKHWSSVLVQVPGEGGQWSTAARIEPRDKWGEDVVGLSTFGYEVGDSVRVRLYWTHEHKVDYLGLTAGVAEASVSTGQLRIASHTTLGDVTAQLSSVGSGSAALTQDDVILMAFDAVPNDPETTRDIVFVTAGSWSSFDDSHPRRGLATPPETAAMQVIGARPSRGAVVVQLDAPYGSQGALRIFDVQGRIVRRLVDGKLNNGREILTWDLRDDGRRPVADGVYFAKFESNGATIIAEKLHVFR